ncbi:MAG: amidase family protein [Pseudomonadota bacterium]
MTLLKMTACEIGDAIEQGMLDPVEVTETYLEAIAANPRTDDIYTAVTVARARASAIAARTRSKSGQRTGRLDGVPMSWKDLFDSAGTATEAGSDLLKNRIPKADATLLDFAEKTGLPCLGKTHMSELAFSGLGLNPITKTSPNINDPDCVPGGSSSGAAASVAFDLAPVAMGSDTGGSIRTPSAWNDLVGFKPRHGTLSMTGAVALCPKFDTAGPLARSVEDAAEVFALLNRSEPVDLLAKDARILKLAVLQTSALDDLDAAVANGFDTALSDLAGAGVSLTDLDHSETAKAMALSPVLFATEAYATWQTTIENAPEKMFPQILERFRSGAAHSGVDYVQAWQSLQRYRQSFKAQFANFDAVILPTVPIMPPKIERLMTDAQYYKSANLMALRNTRIGNLMGLSGISLPCREPSVGIMLLHPHGSNDALLSTAAVIAPILKG